MPRGELDALLARQPGLKSEFERLESPHPSELMARQATIRLRPEHLRGENEDEWNKIKSGHDDGHFIGQMNPFWKLFV